MPSIDVNQNWFWKSSSLICVRINYYLHPAILSECLNNHLIDNNLNELNSIDFIIPRPGRSGTISCVRFVMAVMALWLAGCPSVPAWQKHSVLLFVSRATILYERQDIINSKLENNLSPHNFPAHSDVILNWLGWGGFYDMFELQVRVWSQIIS